MTAELWARAERIANRERDLFEGFAGSGLDDDRDTAYDWIDEIDRMISGGPARAADLLASLRVAQEKRCARLLRAQSAVWARARRELMLLREITSAADVLDSAPAAVCRACGFDRALLSSVRESTWLPVAMFVETDRSDRHHAPPTDVVRGRIIPLTSSMPEAELVRRRSPVLVTAAPADVPVAQLVIEIPASHEYVAAPLLVNGRVIGFVHADCHSTRRPLTMSDCDRLQNFADGLGLVMERAIGIEQVHLQYERVEQALSEARAVMEKSADPWLSPRPAERVRDNDSALTDCLTPREREVMRLLIGGCTNVEIAAQLTVSEGTVKSHMRQILRKLGAANRTEAIARYVSVVRGREAS